jgi:hypothetical protein
MSFWHSRSGRRGVDRKLLKMETYEGTVMADLDVTCYYNL